MCGSVEHRKTKMARKPATLVEFTLFDAVCEAGSLRSNRKVPSDVVWASAARPLRAPWLLAGFGGVPPLAAAIGRDCLEFFMQGTLLDHRVAQFGIIVHGQSLGGIRHGRDLRKLPI